MQPRHAMKVNGIREFNYNDFKTPSKSYS